MLIFGEQNWLLVILTESKIFDTFCLSLGDADKTFTYILQIVANLPNKRFEHVFLETWETKETQDTEQNLCFSNSVTGL